MDWLISFFVESGTFWGAVSAIAAAYAVYHAHKIQKDSQAALRPFFVIKEPGFKPLPNSSSFRIQITMINEGGRPAKNLEYRLVMRPVEGAKKALLDTSASIGMPVPVGSPTPWYNDTVSPGQNTHPHFVFLGLRYDDYNSKKTYKQAFLMRWSGVHDGTMAPDFVYTSKEEFSEFLVSQPDLAKEYQEIA